MEHLAAPLAAFWRYLLERPAPADKAPPEASAVRRAQVSTSKSSGYHSFPFNLGRSLGLPFFFFFFSLSSRLLLFVHCCLIGFYRQALHRLSLHPSPSLLAPRRRIGPFCRVGTPCVTDRLTAAASTSSLRLSLTTDRPTSSMR